MLDIMRRKKRLRLILWLVIAALALSMLVFFVPGVDRAGSRGATTDIATVDGNSISVQHFNNVYRRILNNITDGGRNEINPETIRAMGLHFQVLNNLIIAETIQVVADRFGIKVTDEEVRRAVETHPALQQDGSFIGVQQYKALLAQNYIPIVDFENELRRSETERKLRQIITDALDVSETELRKEFAANHQNTVIDYVFLKKDDYRQRIKPSDSDLQAYFDTHRENYRIEEKRRARYLLVPVSQFLQTEVTEEELLEEWNRFPRGETVEAAHILFLVGDKAEESDVRDRAEAVLKMAQAGRPFPELAQLYSEDPGSADQGGYLGPFQRGQMVGEFEDAAFALDPGEMSGLVRTDFGYHIIHVIDRETPSLESDRAMLTESIRQQKSSDMARRKAEEAAAAAMAGRDFTLVRENLDAVAEINETAPFKRNDNPFELGISRTMQDEIFRLQEVNAIGNVVELQRGYAVPELLEIEPSRPAEFNESRDQIRGDYIEARSEELIRADAEKLSLEAVGKGNLAQAAKEMGFSVRKSREFTINETPDPEIGTSPAFNHAVFSLEPGDVSAPQSVLGNMVVFQVASRSPFDESMFEEQKTEMKENLLGTLREEFFLEYIQNVREQLEQKGRIKINSSVLEQATM
jgi:peptidyl-prolyl cis-trans isomerase D